MRTLEELQNDVLEAYNVMVEEMDILTTSGDIECILSGLRAVLSLRESLFKDYDDTLTDEYDKWLLEERRITGNIEIINKCLDKTFNIAE